MKNLNLLFILLSVSAINIIASSQSTTDSQDSHNAITYLGSSQTGQDNDYENQFDTQSHNEDISYDNNSSSQAAIKNREYNLSQIIKKYRTAQSQVATQQEVIS